MSIYHANNKRILQLSPRGEVCTLVRISELFIARYLLYRNGTGERGNNIRLRSVCGTRNCRRNFSNLARILYKLRGDPTSSVRKHGESGKLFPLRNVIEFVTAQISPTVQIEFSTADAKIHSGPLSNWIYSHTNTTCS